MARGATVSSENLWTVNDVASYLRVSTSMVYKRAEDGTLPCLRIIGSLRFDPEAIRKWAQGEVAPNARAKVVAIRRPKAEGPCRT